jgi:asparagine synthase (glutamine-hydrolysing)
MGWECSVAGHAPPAVVEPRAATDDTMKGLIAIIAVGSASRVEDRELEALAEAYESLRGDGTRWATGDDRARAMILGAEDGGPEAIASSGASWRAVAGRAYGKTAPGAALEELDGQFALVDHDGASGETVVATDPFGLRALYVARHESRIYVSTSCLALAKHLGSPPDRFGLEIFLRAGYHFGARTSWEGIERLEPGMCLTVGVAGSSQRRYWQPEIDRDIRRLAFPELLAHCLQTGSETYGAYLADRRNAWVDLTGGYDTRLLALQLAAEKVPFNANTRGDPDGGDRAIAHEIAAATGWETVDLTTRASWDQQLVDVLPVALGWGDGNLEVLELSWVLWAHEQLSARERSLLIAGGGEHYRGFAWRQEFLAAGKSNRVKMDNWLDMRLLHPMRTELFASDPSTAVRRDFEERMAEWAAPYADELNTTQLDVLYAYKMTGHFGAYLSADGAYLESELPFYFKPIFGAAFSAEHRHRDNHKLMRHMMWHLDPKVAAISTTTGGPAVPWRPGNLHRFAPYYGQIGRKALNKISQRALGRPILPGESQDFYCDAAARRAAVRAVTGSHEPRAHDLRSAPLFDGGVLEDLLRRSFRPGFEETTILGRVLTVELALRALDASLD